MKKNQLELAIEQVKERARVKYKIWQPEKEKKRTLGIIRKRTEWDLTTWKTKNIYDKIFFCGICDKELPPVRNDARVPRNRNKTDFWYLGKITGKKIICLECVKKIYTDKNYHGLYGGYQPFLRGKKKTLYTYLKRGYQ